ncbi:hypothetical protein D9M68_930490 [compost metagenome]
MFEEDNSAVREFGPQAVIGEHRSKISPFHRALNPFVGGPELFKVRPADFKGPGGKR